MNESIHDQWGAELIEAGMLEDAMLVAAAVVSSPMGDSDLVAMSNRDILAATGLAPRRLAAVIRKMNELGMLQTVRLEEN